MKIAVINNFFPPRAGGSAHIADTLAREYVLAGHEVVVITAEYANSPAQENRYGFLIHRLPSWTLPKSSFSFNFDITFAIKRGNYKKLRAILDDFKPDVIHQHGQFFDLTWAAGIWARSRNVPTVLTLHTRLVSPGAITGIVFRILDALVVLPILKFIRPAKVVSIDSTFITYSKKRYRLKEDQETYIPIGIDLEPFKANAELEKIPFKIASLGHVIPLRNRIALIRALPYVLEEFPEAKVHVYGGVYYSAYQEIAEDLDVTDSVLSYGAIAKSQVIPELSSAVVEVHDLQGYGVSIASLEAMAMGIPVVMATPLDYFPHAVLRPGVDFQLVAVDDYQGIANAISELFRNPGLAENISVEGKRYVFDHFDIKEVANQYIDEFRALIRQRHSLD